jgi:nicotinate-nucleotide pyrophosphorylase (carboxylating)
MLELPRVILEDLVRRALAEDLAAGDLTTEACIDALAQGSAAAVARTPLVHCGAFLAALVFELVDHEVRFETLMPEGARCDAKATLWRVSGRARSGINVASVLRSTLCNACAALQP